MEHAFFYGSENHDRVYNTNSMEHWLKRFFTTGVFAGDFQVLANGDMTVKLKGGYVNIGGKVKVYQEEQELRLETAHASYDRIDSIVLERNDPDRDIFVRVVTGGYSSSPSPLVPIRENGVDQRVLAQIMVRHGAVRITQADITDTRANQELCGIVAGTVKEMDFGQFQRQFDSYFSGYKADIAQEFQTWFDSVKNQVTGDMAVRLQDQIEDMHQQLTAYTNQKIADLINGAPESLDTLKEVANTIAAHKTVMDALDAAIGKKANAAEFDSHVKDAVKHITAAERTKWNGKAENAAMTGATASSAGKAGLAPAPAKGVQNSYLTGGGIWQNVDDHAAVFTSGDAASPTGWADVGVIASGEKHSSLMRKFSLAVKNVRYLWKLLGSTSLAGIGDGTVTGAVSSLNTHLKQSAFPYGSLPATNVVLIGIVGKKQNDTLGGHDRNIVFVPTMQSPYHRYGVKRIVSMIIQGIVIIRENEVNKNGFAITITTQTYQGICIALSTPTSQDISGYLCECVFDFYEP